MHIAYFAGYQGDSIIKARSMRRNIALAANQKIRTIATALVEIGNTVTIFSECYPAERSGKHYKSSTENLGIGNTIKVVYAASIDLKYIAVLFPTLTMFFNVYINHRKKKFNLAIIYNFSIFQICYALFSHYFLKIPVFLEYEDDATASRSGHITLFNWLNILAGRLFKNRLRGCFAVSPELINQIGSPNSFLLRGLIAPDISDALLLKTPAKNNILLFSGSFDPSKGIDRLVDAWNSITDYAGWQLHITGDGNQFENVVKAAQNNPSIIYHGLLDRKSFVKLLVSAKACINPHRRINLNGNIFPFKIVEYISVGAVVISTPIESIDAEMKLGMVFTQDDSLIELTNGIKSFLANTDVADLNAAQNYVNLHYSYRTLKESLFKMFSNANLQI